MHLCLHAWMNVCMNVCRQTSISVCIHICIPVMHKSLCLYVCLYVARHSRVYAFVFACMDECMCHTGVVYNNISIMFMLWASSINNKVGLVQFANVYLRYQSVMICPELGIKSLVSEQ